MTYLVKINLFNYLIYTDTSNILLDNCLRIILLHLTLKCKLKMISNLPQTDCYFVYNVWRTNIYVLGVRLSIVCVMY